MSDKPPPPIPLPRTEFTGGVHSSRFGWRASAPFGHLAFDEHELLIWGVGVDVRVKRDEVEAIRLSRGFLATRVSIIRKGGARDPAYFSAAGRGAVRESLKFRGWPIVE